MNEPNTEVLAVCGPPGVGKSSLGWEISAQLRRAGITHAALDSDELDRVWPLSADDREQLCRANLATFWANAAARGVHRLVLVGVFLDRDANRGWLEDALAHASITWLVLEASDAVLEQRVRRREVGSEAEAQLPRSLAVARQFRARHPADGHVLVTDRRSVADLAARAIRLAGWEQPESRPVPAARLLRPSIMVRPYGDADYAACRALWVELIEHHRRIYAEPTIGGEDPGAGFDDYLATTVRVGSWVAEAAGAVVGLTGLLDRGPSGEVEPVVVAEGLRSVGVGQALIARVIDEAQARGYQYLAIRPVARNTSAIRRFHAAGFRTLGGHVDLTMDLGERRPSWMADAHLHGLDFAY